MKNAAVIKLNKRVRLINEKILRPAEHEVWLAFRSENCATTFCDWWWSEGGRLWLEYHGKQ